MFIYLEAQKIIVDILKSRADSIDDLKVEKIRRLQHEDTTIYFVSDTAACKELLTSDSFVPENMGSHIDRLLKRLKIESTGLKDFLEHSPLLKAGEGHLDLRLQFSAVLEEIYRFLPTVEAEAKAHLETYKGDQRVSSSTFIRDYVDQVFSRVFSRLLGTDSLYGPIAASSRGLFDIFPDPRKVIPLTLAIDNFIAGFPHDDVKVSPVLRKNPYICLSLAVMGREPLVGLITAYVNGEISANSPDLETPVRISPVNFIVRRCVADTVLADTRIERNALVYVLLSGANLELVHTYRGVSFGHGAHFCIGYRLAKTMFENFKAGVDLREFPLVPAQSRNKAFLMY